MLMVDKICDAVCQNFEALHASLERIAVSIDGQEDRLRQLEIGLSKLLVLIGQSGVGEPDGQTNKSDQF